jgi:hypothetical protein
MRLITQDGFGADLKGFTPELRGWVSAKCHPRASEEKITYDGLRTGSSPLENARISRITKYFQCPQNNRAK